VRFPMSFSAFPRRMRRRKGKKGERGLRNGRNEWLEVIETRTQRGGKRAIIAWHRGPLGRGQARGNIYKCATSK
jgi:hypothetical protein